MQSLSVVACLFGNMRGRDASVGAGLLNPPAILAGWARGLFRCLRGQLRLPRHHECALSVEADAVAHLRTESESDRLKYDVDRARLEGARLAARTAAHYLNNQLALSAGNAELLLQHPSLPDSARGLAEAVVRGAHSAAETLAHLQQLVRLEELAGAPGGPLDQPILDLERSIASAPYRSSRPALRVVGVATPRSGPPAA